MKHIPNGSYRSCGPRRVALRLTLAVGLAAFALNAPARAGDEGARPASADCVCGLAANPISPASLQEAVGGSGVQHAAVPDGRQNTAVILWDELKRPTPNSPGQGAGGPGGTIRITVLPN